MTIETILLGLLAAYTAVKLYSAGNALSRHIEKQRIVAATIASISREVEDLAGPGTANYKLVGIKSRLESTKNYLDLEV
jgi:hypothetical protein